MSWDAYLVDDRGHDEGSWNYTHNCNGMANLALDAAYKQAASVFDEVFCPEPGRLSWWKRLDGLEGPAGAELLNRIITNMESDPERYRALNPPNNWGDYDSFLKVLRDMRDAVPEWPTKWAVNG
jgi:hypothetical protein